MPIRFICITHKTWITVFWKAWKMQVSYLWKGKNSCVLIYECARICILLLEDIHTYKENKVYISFRRQIKLKVTARFSGLSFFWINLRLPISSRNGENSGDFTTHTKQIFPFKLVLAWCKFLQHFLGNCQRLWITLINEKCGGLFSWSWFFPLLLWLDQLPIGYLLQFIFWSIKFYSRIR